MSKPRFSLPKLGKKSKRQAQGAAGLESKQAHLAAPTHRSGSTAIADLRFAASVVPPSMRVQQRYYDGRINLGHATGVPVGYVFSANGIYDPNITGTGAQPMGFDQMMLFYEHATVINSKLTVTCYNGAVANRVAVYLSAGTTVMSSLPQIMENGYLDTKTLSAVAVAGYIKELNLNCDLAKFLGRPKGAKNLVTDPNLQNTVAANPTEQAYFIITMFDPFGQSTTSMYFDVIIEYDVIYWEPRKLTVS